MKRLSILFVAIAVAACGGGPTPSADNPSASSTGAPTASAVATPDASPTTTPEPALVPDAAGAKLMATHITRFLDDLARLREPSEINAAVIAEAQWETDNMTPEHMLAGGALGKLSNAMLDALTSLQAGEDLTPESIAPMLALRADMSELAGGVATPAPPTAVVVKGSGSKNTKPFNLPSGDYTVTIKGKSKDRYGGNVIVHLVARADESDTEYLVNEIKSGKGNYKYSTNVYGVAGGSYYLDVSMPGGAWSVTFTPLG